MNAPMIPDTGGVNAPGHLLLSPRSNWMQETAEGRAKSHKHSLPSLDG
jgi:hypothetical protein